MATSGSFNTTGYQNRYLTFAWTVEGQDVANNTTTISWTLKGAGVADSTWYKTRSVTLVIDGVTAYSFPGSSSSYITLENGTLVAEGTYTLTHKSDGSRTFEVSVEAGIYTWDVNCTGSKTFTLDTIPRTSVPTLSSTSVDMGSAVTITTNRASSSFTHDLAYSFAGSDYVSIATGVGASYKWTTPDLASSIPSATSGTLTIRCITKSGSTTVGTKTVTMTLKVPTDVVPSVSDVSVVETTDGLAEQFGAFVKSKSKIKTTITATGAKGSTIKSYSTTFNGKTYAGSSWTSPEVTESGTLSLITTVTDSRGRTAKKTTTITVLDYNAPVISAMQIHRVNADGVADQDGIYLAIWYQYSVTALNDKNTASAVVEYRQTLSAEWATLLSGSDLSADTTVLPTEPTFSTDYQYDLRLTVTDWFGTTRAHTVTLDSGAVILDISADGKGIAFGKTSESAGIEMGWPLLLQGGFTTMILPDGTDLDTVTVFATYAGRNQKDVSYVNIPFSHGTFTLEVLPAGDEGQIFQRLTYCSKTDPAVYVRYYYDDTWGDWVQL